MGIILTLDKPRIFIGCKKAIAAVVVVHIACYLTYVQSAFDIFPGKIYDHMPGLADRKLCYVWRFFGENVQNVLTSPTTLIVCVLPSTITISGMSFDFAFLIFCRPRFRFCPFFTGSWRLFTPYCASPKRTPNFISSIISPTNCSTLFPKRPCTPNSFATPIASRDMIGMNASYLPQ